MATTRSGLFALAALAGMCGFNTEASAQLVGFHVKPDMYGRGLVITSFIPNTSAYLLYQQGELMPGDIITHYDGQRVYSAAHVRQISRHTGGGKMNFMTPWNAPFFHYVDAGGNTAACMEFRRGSGRPAGGGGGGVRPGGPGRPSGPGRPGRPW